jgi:hypothetical protein
VEKSKKLNDKPKKAKKEKKPEKPVRVVRAQRKVDKEIESDDENNATTSDVDEPGTV